MKKFIFAVLALCCVLSCTKEPANEVNPTSIKFVAAIGEDDSAESKTTVSGEGKVAWVTGDEVSISNGAETKIYKVTGVDEHRYATLEVKSGTGFSEDGDYTATYGDVNNQWYYADKAGSNCPMEAEANANGGECKFAFKNSCGVVAVKADTGTNKIAQIKIGNKTLNFATPQALDGTYLVAVTPGEDFTEVAFVKDDGSKASKTISSAASVEKNKIRDLKTGDYFNKATYDGFEPVLTPGVFSVSADKKIRFTRGNLFVDKTKSPFVYGFESNQYDPVFGAGESHKTHFLKADYLDSGKNFIFKDLNSEPCKGARALTESEWNYLLGFSTKKRAVTNFFAKLRVNGQAGLLLYPDSYTWPNGVAVPDAKINETDCSYWTLRNNYTVEDFEKLEAAGFVFLPVCGRTYSSEYSYDGQYDTSKKENNTSGSARYLTSDISTASPYKCLFYTYAQLLVENTTSNYGYSIRLVADFTE